MNRERLRQQVVQFNRRIGFTGGVKKLSVRGFQKNSEFATFGLAIAHNEKFLDPVRDPHPNIGIDLIMRANRAT